MNMSDLQKRIDDAVKNLGRLRSSKRAEMVAVEQRYEPEIDTATRELVEAKRALESHISSATPDHEHEGRRVTKLERVGPWHRTEVRIFGIIETMRVGTKMPQNCKYGLPKIGAAFVRLLKKDGTPGLKFYATSSFGRSNGPVTVLGGWKLVEPRD